MVRVLEVEPVSQVRVLDSGDHELSEGTTAAWRLADVDQHGGAWIRLSLRLDAGRESAVPLLHSWRGHDPVPTTEALPVVLGRGEWVDVLTCVPVGTVRAELALGPLGVTARLRIRCRVMGGLEAAARLARKAVPKLPPEEAARWVAAAIPALVDRRRRRHVRETLVQNAAGGVGGIVTSRGMVLRPAWLPARGVEARGGDSSAWTAMDADPQFRLVGLESLAGEWVRVSLTLRGGGRNSPPVLYFDAGSGMSEVGSVRLPTPSRTVPEVSRVLRLPPGLKAVRLDPLADPGEFQLEAVRVEPLGTRKAALEMLERLGRPVSRVSRLREAWRVAALARVGQSDALNALVGDYEFILQDDAAAYADWCETAEAAPVEWPALTAKVEQWQTRPLISVLMPVYNTPATLLDEAIRSVVAQVYPHWELCIVDDASTAAHVSSQLASWARQDRRIKVMNRASNGHISLASNDALKMATGMHVALLDHDDRLHPLALYAVAEVLAARPELGLVYTDEDKLDGAGRRLNPYFKCDFNPELMLAQNMVCHLGVYRTDLLRDLGGFRVGLEGAQDWDLALRVYERVGLEGIHHISRVLYHWRMHAGSTALAAAEKSYAAVAGRRAVQDHLARTGRAGIVVPAPEIPSLNRVRFALPNPPPHVTLIIPTRDRADVLRTCLSSLVERTRYPSWDALVVDNGTVQPEALQLLGSLDPKRFRVIRDDSPFNYSALNNRAVAKARGELICLLNNDIEVLTPDWLEELVSFAVQPGVGAVGARLWYPDGRLQHGGVVLGVGGVAGHAHKLLPRGKPGYFGRAVLHQSFSAVTAACLLVRKALYEQVGGLDESLAVAFNDVDFCLRVRTAGCRNVWTPYAELVHHESVSRGHEDTPEKVARFHAEHGKMRERWDSLLEGDPAYSPHLSRRSEGFERA